MTNGRNDAGPLWSKVLEDLRRRVRDGEFTERFPRDVELVAYYQVSRHTVREATRRLQAEGILERHRGRGSFLSHRPIEQPLGSLYSLFRSIEDQGLVQESVVVHLEERCNETVATRLGCPPDAPLVFLDRIRLADKVPIVLDQSWLPSSMAKALLDLDFGHTALYEQLARACGVRLTSGWERISPFIPSPSQRRQLRIDSRQLAYAVERMTYQDDVPVEWRTSVVCSDRFRFVARWTTGQMTTGFEPGDP